MAETITPLDVGDRAPEFTLAAADGTAVTLAQHRGLEGVILYFLRAFT